MRKILSLILFLGIIFNLSSLKVLGAIETINYGLTFTDNKRWDINTGSYINDLNYMATNRVRIRENNITLNNLNFNHILFWSDSIYLGYYNTTAGGFENLKYLGDTGVTVTPPANATWFSLTSYKLAPNDLPQTTFNGDSLEDVFTVDYKNVNITTLNNLTLRVVFEGSNLWKPPFNLENLIQVGDTYIENNTTINTRIFKIGQTIIGNTYYLRGDIKRSIGGVTYYFLGNVISSNTTLSSNVFTTLIFQLIPTNTTSFSIYSNVTQGSGEIFEYRNIFFINKTSLGITSLTINQMNTYYNAYVSPNILLQAFNEYNSLTFTQTQLDEYLVIYTDNLVWADGVPILLFYSMEATYDREEFIPDDRDFLEKLTDWLDDFGLGDFPKILISLTVFIAIAVIMFFARASMLAILIVEFTFFVMLVVFGFFPLWLVIVVAIVLLALIVLAFKGGI